MPVEDDDFPAEAVAAVPPVVTSPDPRGPLTVTTPESLVPEPHRVPAEDENDEQETLPEFDPRYREDMDGLMFLGRLTKEFTRYGHRFQIRTLGTDALLEIGLLHKPYQDTLADVKAYQALLVAACVDAVDGLPLPIPVTNLPADTVLLNRFNYVKKHWFPPLLDVVYEEYLLLERRVDKVLEAMGKASR